MYSMSRQTDDSSFGCFFLGWGDGWDRLRAFQWISIGGHDLRELLSLWLIKCRFEGQLVVSHGGLTSTQDAGWDKQRRQGHTHAHKQRHWSCSICLTSPRLCCRLMTPPSVHLRSSLFRWALWRLVTDGHKCRPDSGEHAHTCKASAKQHMLKTHNTLWAAHGRRWVDG